MVPRAPTDPADQSFALGRGSGHDPGAKARLDGGLRAGRARDRHGGLASARLAGDLRRRGADVGAEAIEGAGHHFADGLERIARVGRELVDGVDIDELESALDGPGAVLVLERHDGLDPVFHPAGVLAEPVEVLDGEDVTVRDLVEEGLDHGGRNRAEHGEGRDVVERGFRVPELRLEPVDFDLAAIAVGTLGEVLLDLIADFHHGSFEADRLADHRDEIPDDRDEEGAVARDERHRLRRRDPRLEALALAAADLVSLVAVGAGLAVLAVAGILARRLTVDLTALAGLVALLGLGLAGAEGLAELVAQFPERAIDRLRDLVGGVGAALALLATGAVVVVAAAIAVTHCEKSSFFVMCLLKSPLRLIALRGWRRVGLLTRVVRFKLYHFEVFYCPSRTRPLF